MASLVALSFFMTYDDDALYMLYPAAAAPALKDNYFVDNNGKNFFPFLCSSFIFLSITNNRSFTTSIILALAIICYFKHDNIAPVPIIIQEAIPTTRKDYYWIWLLLKRSLWISCMFSYIKSSPSTCKTIPLLAPATGLTLMSFILS